MKREQATKRTMAEVASHFEEWRREKKNRRERIPERLWAEAIDLLSDYPISEVAKQLRLSGTDLKKQQAANVKDAKTSKEEQFTRFVEIEPVVVGEVSSMAVGPVRLELERPDGLRLRIESGNSGDLLRVVERFMEERPCCN